MGIIRPEDRTLALVTLLSTLSLIATLVIVVPLFVGAAIQASSNVTTYPATYTNQTNSYFNFTWGLNATANLTLAVVELNYTGTSTNYSLTRTACTEENCTWYFAIIHPAGSYYWKGFAIDNFSEQSTVGPGYFTIAKATVPVILNMSNGTHSVMGPITINENTSLWLNGTVPLPYEYYTLTLAIDGVAIGATTGNESALANRSNYTLFATPGTYNVSLSHSTQNYTGYLSYFVHVQDTTAPSYVSNSSVTPATFNATAQANFTVEWSDWNLTGMQALLTVNRSGVLTTYAMSNASSNLTVWNFTTSDFPAGTHYWRSNATDVYGNVNDAMAWSAFTVAQASPVTVLWLGDVAGNKTLDPATNIWLNGSVTTGDSSYTLNLYIDGVLLGTNASGRVENQTSFASLGTRNISLNYTSTQNYSASERKYILTVSDTTPPAYSAAAVATPYYMTDQANFTVNWTDWNQTLSATLVINRSVGGGNYTSLVYAMNSIGALTWNYSLTDWSAGTHYWRMNATDAYGNVNETMNWSSFTIAQGAPTVSLALAGVSGPTSIFDNTSIWLNATKTTGDPTGYMALRVDATLLYNSTASYGNYTLFSTPGTYNISLTYEASQNYTQSFISYLLQVNDTTSPSYVSNSSVTPATFNATAQANFTVEWSDWNLTGMQAHITVNRSGVLTTYAMSNASSNLTVWNFTLGGLPAGTHYWRANATDVYGNVNDAMAWSAFTVAQAAPTLTLANQSAGTSTYGTNPNVTCTASAAEVVPLLFRNGSAVGNPDDAVLPVGSWAYICNSTQTQNYTATSVGPLNVSISQTAPELDLTLAGVEGNTSVNVNTAVWLNGSLVTGDSGAVLSLYLDGALLGNGTAPANLTNLTALGLYNITLSSWATQNYTAGSVTYWLSVNDTTAPSYVSNASAAPGTFNVTSQANFTVNWTDWNLAGMQVYITVNRSGVLTTYQMSNSTGPTAWNFSLSDLPAGTHYWRANATDAYGNLNDAMAWSAFTVAKATPVLSLTLNGTSGAVTMDEDASIWLNGSLVAGDSGAEVMLSMTDQENILTIVHSQTNGTPLANFTLFSTPDVFNVSLNYTAATQNYSAASVSYILTVNDLTAPEWSSPWNSTPATFNASSLLQFNITWADNSAAGLGDIRIEINRSGVLANYTVTNFSAGAPDATHPDGFPVFNLSLAGFPAGTHAWRSYADDHAAPVNANTTPWYFFTIAQATPALSLTLNGTAGDVTIQLGASIWLNGSLLGNWDTEASLSIYRSADNNFSSTVLIGTGTSGTSVANLTAFPAAGLFNITLNYTQTQNYSARMVSYLVNVTNDSCGTLTASKTLLSDITTSGTCFTIGADNVVLDGNGFTITGVGGIGGSGIYAAGRTNLTIRNFGGINTFYQGIAIYNVSNATVTNNTIDSPNGSGYGVGIGFFSGSTGITLTSNTIWTASLDYPGISLHQTNNSLVASNTVVTNGTSSSGINLTASSYNTLTGNVILTSGSDAVGLLVEDVYAPGESIGNIISGNLINSTNAPEIRITTLSNATNISLAGELLLGRVNLSTNDSVTNVSIDVNTTPAADPGGYQNLSIYPVFTFSDGGYGNFIINYGESNFTAFPESSIRLVRESGGSWTQVINAPLDTSSNTLTTGTLNTSGTYALFGTNNTDCGTLTASATLNMNLTSSGTCFTIGADNVVLDGNGFSITGNGEWGYPGITSGYDNITIKNFAGISGFDKGILLDGAVGVTITNNTFTDQGMNGSGDSTKGKAINLRSNSWGAVITLNTIQTTMDYYSGIILEGTNHSLVASNTIVTSGIGASGINLTSSSYNKITDNIILTSGGNATGLLFQKDSKWNLINGNLVNSTSSPELGISLSFIGPYSDTPTPNISGMILLGRVNLTSGPLADVIIDVNTTPAADPEGKRNLSIYPVFTFSAGGFGDFNITYADSDVTDFQESSIRLFRESGGSWTQVINATLDAAANTLVTGNISTTGTYALFGTNYTACGTLIESATLGRNLTTSGTCFTIAASNVVLDGNGFTITYTNGTVGLAVYGVHDNGGAYNNITIRNFGGISNFSPGIWFEGQRNVTISNNTLILLSDSPPTLWGGIGIGLVEGSDGTAILSNTLQSTRDYYVGISLRGTNDSIVASNTIVASGADSAGINLSRSSYNNLTENTILTNVVGVAYASGILIDDSWSSGGGSSLGNILSGNRINSSNASEIRINLPSGTPSNRLIGELLLGRVNLTSNSFNNITIDVNTTPSADPEGKRNLSDYLTLSSVSGAAFIDFNLSFTDADFPAGFDRDTVRLYWYNESASAWSLVNTSSFDTTSLILRSGNITSPSGLYAPFGDFNGTEPTPTSHSPSGEVTSAPTDLTVTTAVNATCRYSGSTGIPYANMTNSFAGNATGHTLSLGTVVLGSYHYYVRCNNTLSVVSTSDYDASFTYTVAAPVSSGGGGGGLYVVPVLSEESAEPISGDELRDIIESFQVNVEDGTAEIVVTNEGIPVMSIEFDIDSDVAVIDVVVTVHSAFPAEPGRPTPEGESERDVNLYKYVEIDLNVSDEDSAGNVTVSFKVDKSWVAAYDSDPEEVVLQRYHDGTWQDLPTTLVDQSGSEYYYEADSDGFSVFAIVIKAQTPVEPVPTGAAVTQGEPGAVAPPGPRLSLSGVPVFIRDYLPLVMTFFVILLVSGLFGFYFVYLRKQLFVRAMERKREESIYLFPHFDCLPQSKYAYIGLVADTNVQTYLDHTQLNLHTLVAGGTGSGKTVAGMVIVEELVKHGDASIIVFDPVGQWTGFLAKNSSKEMLKHYPRFSLKGGKAFKAEVLDITKETLDLDMMLYLKRKGLTVLKMDRLTPGQMDCFIEESLEKVYRARLPEQQSMAALIVLDEVHRLLPKYGGGRAHLKLEQAVREFRKWGIGLLMVSQVLTDFKGAIRGNIGTEIQLRTRYEGDIRRVRERHGPEVSRLVSKMPVGTAMVESVGYNKGMPYFVEFRPLLHSPMKLSEDELKKLSKAAKPALLVPEKITSYVETCRAKGFGDEAIRQELLVKGWKRDLVERALGPKKKK